MKKLKLFFLYYLIAALGFGISTTHNCIAQPRTGDWTIPCGFGQFVIKVGCNGTCITDIIYTWSNFHCDGITLVSGSIHSMRTGGWAITNNSFSIQTSVSPGTMTINGTFSQNGNEVSGSYSFNVYGTICSGNWGPIASSIENVNDDIPAFYFLSQNYPNPFNPVTKIRFGLPVGSFTKLVVYDLLGREVTTLVNKELHAGFYEISYNANWSSSGVYFIKLQTKSFVSLKKMVYIK